MSLLPPPPPIWVTSSDASKDVVTDNSGTGYWPSPSTAKVRVEEVDASTYVPVELRVLTDAGLKWGCTMRFCIVPRSEGRVAQTPQVAGHSLYCEIVTATHASHLALASYEEGARLATLSTDVDPGLIRMWWPEIVRKLAERGVTLSVEARMAAVAMGLDLTLLVPADEAVLGKE